MRRTDSADSAAEEYWEFALSPQMSALAFTIRPIPRLELPSSHMDKSDWTTPLLGPLSLPQDDTISCYYEVIESTRVNQPKQKDSLNKDRGDASLNAGQDLYTRLPPMGSIAKYNLNAGQGQAVANLSLVTAQQESESTGVSQEKLKLAKSLIQEEGSKREMERKKYGDNTKQPTITLAESPKSPKRKADTSYQSYNTAKKVLRIPSKDASRVGVQKEKDHLTYPRSTPLSLCGTTSAIKSLGAPINHSTSSKQSATNNCQSSGQIQLTPQFRPNLSSAPLNSGDAAHLRGNLPSGAQFRRQHQPVPSSMLSKAPQRPPMARSPDEFHLSTSSAMGALQFATPPTPRHQAAMLYRQHQPALFDMQGETFQQYPRSQATLQRPLYNTNPSCHGYQTGPCPGYQAGPVIGNHAPSLGPYNTPLLSSQGQTNNLPAKYQATPFIPRYCLSPNNQVHLYSEECHVIPPSFRSSYRQASRYPTTTPDPHCRSPYCRGGPVGS